MAQFSELNDTQTSFGQAVADYEKAKADRDVLLQQVTEAGFADLIEAQKQTGAELIAALKEASDAAAKASTDLAATIAANQAAQAAAKVANDNPYAQYLQYGIPGFASGGMSYGGLHIVGEEGPELRNDGPARYWSAQQTKDMLVGGDNSAAIDRLGARMQALEAAVREGNADRREGNQARLKIGAATIDPLKKIDRRFDAVTAESGGDAIKTAA